jgi:hypothetical protein
MLNNPFLPDLLLYFFVFFFVFYLTFFIGRVIVQFIPILNNTVEPIAKVFYSLVLGFVIIVSFFAIIWTKFNSVYLISLILFLFYLIQGKNINTKLNIEIKSDIRFSFLIFILFAFFFFISYYIFFIRSGGAFFNDHIIYADMSYVLSMTHIESASMFTNSTNATAYHYSDLWFTAIISLLFNLNYIYTLLLISYTFLGSLAVLAVIVFARIYFNGYFLPLLFGIGFMFFKPFIAFLFDFIDPIAINPKLFIIPVILIFSVIQFLNKNYYFSQIILLLLVPFYSPMAPGILGGLFLFSIFCQYYENKFRFRISFFYNKYTLTCFFIFVFFIGFYLCQSFFSSITSSQVALYEHPIPRALLFFVKKSGRVFVLLFPITLSLLYFNKKNKLNIQPFVGLLIFTVLGVILSAFVAGVVANYILDGYQICTNFTDTVVNVVVVVCLIFLLSTLKTKFVYFALLVLIPIYYFTFFSWVYETKEAIGSTKNELLFYSQLKYQLRDFSSPNFAYIRNYRTNEHENSQYCRLNIYYPLSKLPHVIPSGYYSAYCLSIFDLPENTEPRFDERRLSEFWNYVQKSRFKSSKIKFSDYALNFIRDKEIKFVIVEKNALTPKYLNDNSILLNQYDGNRIYKMITKK